MEVFRCVVDIDPWMGRREGVGETVLLDSQLFPLPLNLESWECPLDACIEAIRRIYPVLMVI